MKEETTRALGRGLYEAAKTRTRMEVITKTHPGLTAADAYAIQQAMVRAYVEDGCRIAGRKVGMTSRAMQEQFGIDEPDYGYLFEHLGFGSGDLLDWGQFIEPMVEAELAFRLKDDLHRGPVTAEDVLDATEYVVAALEIIDTRTQHFDTRIEDSIADNASFAAYVLGDIPVKPGQCDLSLVGLIAEKNGRQIATSCGASVMGNPAQAMAWLANKMIALGRPLKAGELVLSGSFIAAIPVQKGDVLRAKYGTFGEITAIF